jgi:ATP-binding cassette subfamily C protein
MLRVRGRGVAIDATAVWDRLMRLPMRYHNERSVASRVTDANAVDTSSARLSDGVIVAFLDIALVGGALVGVLTASLWLAAGLLAFLAVRAAVEIRLVRRSALLTRQVLEASTSARSLTLDLLTGVNRLRVSGATARGFARWADRQSMVTRLQVRQRRLDVVQQTLSGLWWVLGLVVIFTVTALTGAGIGELVTAQAALTAAMKALTGAVGSIGAGLSAAAVMRRAESVLRAEPESGTGQEVAQLAGAVDVRDVVFRYREDLPPILNGVSMTIPAGAHVAVVGPSGSGKSTLLRLLLGLAEPDAGIVSFDGRDLSGLDRSSVRRQIGVVMQSSQLMPGSIRDNVDLGRGLSTARIWEALEAAAVADDVRAMPLGLATAFVEGGGTLSGGQRQRILLARALAGRPRILMLDEATSALDNVSQAAVIANLERLEVTRIVVAHRLSTIQKADLIVMISDGRVVAQGRFDELMSRDGPFRDLVARQQV